MGSGKRARAFSAGYLDKGEMNLLSRPNSRNILTQEWIASMREKGIIISDAEMRYRKWLALSNSQKPLILRSSHVRPFTAPSMILTKPRHNRSSKLRRESQPEPHAEVNCVKLAQQKRYFERQCRSFTSLTIRTEGFPEIAESTPHQFIIGSRYNYSRVIDSRSLSRLGVYTPRSNLAGTFINPAGILPPPNARYGRLSSVISPTLATVTRIPKHSLLFPVHSDIKTDITSSVNLSCGSSLSDSPSDRPKEAIGICDEEDRKELSNNGGLSDTRDNDGNELQQQDDSEGLSNNGGLSDTRDNNGNELQEQDGQLMISQEASNLANQILEESAIDDPSIHTTVPPRIIDVETVLKATDSKVLVVDDSGDLLDTASDNPSAKETIIDSSHEEQSVMNDVLVDQIKSSSTLIVDMSQLQVDT